MLMIAYVLLHFAIYLGFRLQFLIWNWANLKFLSANDLFIAFIYGFRFDAASIAAQCGLFLAGWVWLEKFRLSKKIWFTVFTFFNVLMILLNFADAELVNFTGRRFSKVSLFLVGEGSVTNLIVPYLPMFAITVLVVLLYILASVFFFRRMQPPKGILKKLATTAGVLVLSVVAFRGGLQLKPMTTVDARLFPDTMANHLVLNSTFTFLKSLKQSPIERVHYYKNDQMLALLNAPSKVPSVYQQNIGQVNIVVLIVESLSKEYTEFHNPDFTPFINQLAQDGASFPKAYANARRSIEGIGALLAGIPALMEEPFINSEFSSNEFIALGHVLAKKGYHSSFFHGARNGSMHFDAFAKSLGIQNYFGESEFPDKSQNDGTWGIYDGPFLKFACEKMSSFPQPFLSSVFTLSSHQPYNIPQDGEIHPTGPHPILKTIHYTDSSIKKFFECAKSKPWFEKTLFVITSDHTGPSLNPQSSFKSKFEIPLIFYMKNPGALKALPTDQFAQQIDLLPTLLETLKANPQTLENHLARSLWRPGPKIIPLFSDGRYELVGDVKDDEKQLKAVRQYFSEGLFDNRLYYPVGSATK